MSDLTLTFVPLNDQSSDRRAFLFPGVDGSFAGARHFSASLRGWSVFAVVIEHDVLGNSVIDIATRFRQMVEELRIPLIGALIGYSFGAYIALEVAKEWGDQSPPIVVLDTELDPESRPAASPAATMWYIAEHHGMLTQSSEFKELDRLSQIELILEQCPGLRRIGRIHLDQLYHLIESNSRAYDEYEITPSARRSLVVASRNSSMTQQAVPGWKRTFLGELAIVFVPGTHRSIFNLSNGEILAETLATFLDGECRRRAPSIPSNTPR